MMEDKDGLWLYVVCSTQSPVTKWWVRPVWHRWLWIVSVNIHSCC